QQESIDGRTRSILRTASNINNIIHNAPISTNTTLLTEGVANGTITSNTNDTAYTNHIIPTRTNRDQQHQLDADIDDIMESCDLPAAQKEDGRVPPEHGQEKASNL
ncbi:hypothetical protein BGX30_008769, partial [Mortierella sp. GBA39]